MGRTAAAPQFVLIGGPNGAGKSTCAPALLPEGMPYINADEIAKGLDDGDGRNVRAARLLFGQWDRLVRDRADFGVETTLASRSLAPRVRQLRASGYRFHLLYLWLPSVELAIARVAARARAGGHDIPEQTIRRRYALGAHNFLELFRPMADTWHVYQNVEAGRPELVAHSPAGSATVVRPEIWEQIQRSGGYIDVRRAQPADVESRFRDCDFVTSAIAMATHGAVVAHRRAGRSIATMCGDAVRIVHPCDIEVREEGESI